MPRAQRSRRALLFIGVPGVFCLVLTGWIYVASTGILSKEAPKLRICSPNGVYCASLVLRYNYGNSSDVYYLRLKDMKHLTAWSHWADVGKGEQILMTTDAGPTRLIWKDSLHLAAICDSCSMNRYDVVREKKKVGPVSITYIGFPPPAP